jgi:hypothetical protein
VCPYTANMLSHAQATSRNLPASYCQPTACCYLQATYNLVPASHWQPTVVNCFPAPLLSPCPQPSAQVVGAPQRQLALQLRAMLGAPVRADLPAE